MSKYFDHPCISLLHCDGKIGLINLNDKLCIKYCISEYFGCTLIYLHFCITILLWH